ncbi:ribonuclease III [Tessaracoccus sp. OH4464_COT-324]|uniref:ribonuclease III n=1 Tax=Tessaracoccus sp. OH4464_COT-324 TaxID=2491059 RepID=UPI001F3351C2|nr:ribonuclease III [Tessaracoccus sp. OH4464_COT-324]
MVDVQLFELALTHRSYAYEAGGLPSNERLEFLGDAVLEIVVTDHIYRTYPELSEGELAKLRASVVSAVALAGIARRLGIGPMIKLGRGEIATNGADKKSILADTTEAIIGAIYLSSSMAGAERFIHHIFDPLIVESLTVGDYSDHKTTIQELSARHGWQVVYEVEGSGPDHNREYHATVFIDGVARGQGTAPNKRRAEQLAARQAVAELGDA